MPAAAATSSIDSTAPALARPQRTTSLPIAAVGTGAEVDRDHVHRDAADGARANAVDEDRRAALVVARRQARIAVGVAAGGDADAHRALGA